MKDIRFHLLFCLSLALAAQVPNEPTEIARVAMLGKVWGQVKAVHPDLATKDIDWDRALLEAIPKAEKAKGKEAFAQVVDAMLQALGDPATHVARSNPTGGPILPKDFPFSSWLEPGTLLVHLNVAEQTLSETMKISDQIQDLCREADKAHRVIIDLRPPRSVLPRTEDHAVDEALLQRDTLFGLARTLIGEPLPLPAQRFVTSLGYAGSGQNPDYFSGLTLKAAPVLQPASPGTNKLVAFLVSDESIVTEPVLALCEAGRAVLITEGDLARDWSAETRVVSFGTDLKVVLRTSDRVFADGSARCLPDLHVEPSTRWDAETPGVQAALAAFTRPARPAAKSGAGLGTLLPVLRPERTYPDALYPGRELRILAAIRLWSVIDRYFPHKDLMDVAWDRALEDGILRLGSAANEDEYQLSALALVARLQDSHGALRLDRGSLLDRTDPAGVAKLFGTGSLPVSLAMLGGQPVVTGLWDETMAQAGFKIGDEIRSIDGEPAQARIVRLRPYVCASTPQRLDLILANRLLGGALGSAAEIEVLGVDGKVRTIHSRWGESRGKLVNGVRAGAAVRILDGNIGYVDLDKIKAGEIEPMLPALKRTRAMIFDMRGYPNSGSLDAEAAFIRTPMAKSDQGGIPLVLGLETEVQEMDGLSVTSSDRVSTRPPSDYAQPVVVLIDERCQSWGESTCLDLEAGCKATFIGSPTSGATGSITYTTLPGGLRVVFTGSWVRHGDGRPFQRVGIQPSILVRPTAKGLAQGRDEVLERAIAHLTENH